jgi:cytochrome c-type biogenesis protein CcmH/NrfG
VPPEPAPVPFQQGRYSIPVPPPGTLPLPPSLSEPRPNAPAARPPPVAAPPSKDPLREAVRNGRPQQEPRSRAPLALVAAAVVAIAGGALFALRGGEGKAEAVATPTAPGSPEAVHPERSDAASAAERSRRTETANVIPARTRSDDGNHRRILASADRKYEAGRFLEAVEDYRRAVALRPTSPANVGLARALYDANQSAEALRTLEEAIAEDGRYAPAWLLLGEIKQASGKDAQARAAYQRFLQLAPDGDQARAVREILARQK